MESATKKIFLYLQRIVFVFFVQILYYLNPKRHIIQTVLQLEDFLCLLDLVTIYFGNTKNSQIDILRAFNNASSGPRSNYEAKLLRFLLF
jgi:hypothetical protein